MKSREEDITDLDPDSVIVDEVPSKRRRVHKRVHHVEWGLGLLGLLAGLGGLAAGRLGHIWVAFDVFSQFGLQFILMAVSFGLGLLLPRFKGTFGMVATVIGLFAIGLWPHIATQMVRDEPLNIESGEVAVRVAHFNVFQENKNNKDIIAELERLDADVVTLIEFTKEKDDVLLALKLTYPHQFTCTNVNYCHLAIISKKPMVAIDAKSHWVGAAYISATFPSLGNLNVVGVHTTRFPYSRAQLRQVTTLVKHLKGSRGPMVLMGDVNSTPFSRIHDVITQGLNLNRLTMLPTWPSKWELPQLAIDHIFVSRQVRMVSQQEIGNAVGSDHYPIAMTVAVKK